MAGKGKEQRQRKKGKKGLRKHGRSYRWFDILSSDAKHPTTHSITKYRLRHHIGSDEKRFGKNK